MRDLTSNDGEDDRWREGGSGDRGKRSDREGKQSNLEALEGGRGGECGGEGPNKRERAAGVRTEERS